MQPSTAGKMLKIAHFQHIGQAAGFHWVRQRLFYQF
jgi:hypothetical protein